MYRNPRLNKCYIWETSRRHSLRIQGYSGLYFPAFGLNTGRYGVSLRIQSEYRKVRTRITPNTDTFHAVISDARHVLKKFQHFNA